MMMQNTSQPLNERVSFKRKMQDSLLKNPSIYKTIQVAKNTNVYVAGDEGNQVYFIESGAVKLLVFSPEGKECILAVYSLGDVFGESGTGNRVETAKTMTNTQLKIIPLPKFLAHLAKEELLEGFVKYLAVRVADQQQVIANLVTLASEQRLGKTLLQLASSIGKKTTNGTVIEFKLSHQELSKMIGATRPRTSLFMSKFCALGLVTITKKHHIIIDEQKLSNYLAQIA